MHLNDFAPAHFERMGREIGFRSVETTVGTSRNSSNMVEKLGAAIFGFIGRVYEVFAPSSHPFPYAGAYTYLLRK